MKDLIGASCSALCIVHCLALPILIAVGVPVVGLAFLENENVHLILSVVVLGVALLAFPYGWKIHRRLLPGILAVIGSSLLMLSLVMPEALEVYLAASAGILLIWAHVSNRRFLTTPMLTTQP